jgi:hypothetical protein
MYANPTELVGAKDDAQAIQQMLIERYNEWWVLDRIIERGKIHIYYFRSEYKQAATAFAVE